jgi:hypothetical protein
MGLPFACWKAQEYAWRLDSCCVVGALVVKSRLIGPDLVNAGACLAWQQFADISDMAAAQNAR